MVNTHLSDTGLAINSSQREPSLTLFGYYFVGHPHAWHSSPILPALVTAVSWHWFGSFSNVRQVWNRSKQIGMSVQIPKIAQIPSWKLTFSQLPQTGLVFKLCSWRTGCRASSCFLVGVSLSWCTGLVFPGFTIGFHWCSHVFTDILCCFSNFAAENISL